MSNTGNFLILFSEFLHHLSSSCFIFDPPLSPFSLHCFSLLLPLFISTSCLQVASFVRQLQLPLFLLSSLLTYSVSTFISYSACASYSTFPTVTFFQFFSRTNLNLSYLSFIFPPFTDLLLCSSRISFHFHSSLS